MNVTSSGRDGGRAVSEMVQLVQSTYSEMMPVGDEGGLVRLEQTLYGQRGLQRSAGGVRWLVAVAAVVALLGGGALVYRQSDKLTFEVMNGSIGPGGFVRPTSAGTAILFSEGSEISLGESARARVDNLTSNGGLVVVENGSVHARIVPRKRARWFVEAGPYTIRVTGTAFNVKWSWEDERLEVKMDHGSVIVTGPLAPAGVTLTGGMQLTVNPRSGLVIGAGVAGATAGGSEGGPRQNPRQNPQEAPFGDEVAAQAVPSTQATQPTVNLNDAASVPAADRSRPLTGGRQRGSTIGWTARRGAGDRRIASASTTGGNAIGVAAADSSARGVVPWDRQLAEGNAQGILNDAEARGIDRVLVSVSGRELSALADAARYRHRPTLARRVLLSLRDRFPLGTEAHDAAFFLGGLAEDAGGPTGATGANGATGATGASGLTAALDWYERYLHESTHGRYAAQALGRKMVITQKVKGNESARAVAAEYLDRFPDGPYASAARKLTRGN